MISPFAPLFPWLRETIGCAALEYSADSTIARPEIDCRDLQTRATILRALHDAGHSRPWALGTPWSVLTDEQAGRATAEIVRAVGEDPGKPAAVVPIGVLEAWTLHAGSACWDRKWTMPAHKKYRYWYARAYTSRFGVNHEHGNWYVTLADATNGPETGEPGRLACDNAARKLGCLMIEDLTP